MRYTPTTLANYDVLFKTAHQELVKEAGLFSRMGTAVARRLSRLKKPAVTPAAAEAAEAATPAAAETAAAVEAATPAAVEAVEAATPAAVEAVTNKKIHPALIALLSGGIGAGGTVGYGLYREAQKAQEAEEARKRTRNLAFGAGLASGITAPHLIRGLGTIARGMGGTGLFPEFQQRTY